MNSGLTPTRANHSRTAVAVSSGPLSERRHAGVPRATKSSVSCWRTSSEVRRRATRMARHSRVYSVHHRQQAQRPPVVLLQAGVDLYELRPDSNMTRQWSTMAEKSTAALHAKGMVFDRQSVWIGSFNLDPRSIGINTEVGVMIDSPEIAAKVAAFMGAPWPPGARIT